MAMRHLILSLLVLSGLTISARDAFSQRIEENPVYVDDSPQAWELYRRAQDQVSENPSEAARLYQQLLDEYAYRLIPRAEGSDDQMLSVRSRVHDALRNQPVVLGRYRLLQTAEAERLRNAGELEAVVRTRFFTAPALDALLQLVQNDLEASHFHRAFDRLRHAEGHPDLEGRAHAFYWFMRALAAHHTGDALAAHDARQQLARVDAIAARTLRPELDRLLDLVANPVLEPVYSPGAPTPLPEFDAMHGQPIWSLPLDESLVRRAFAIDASNIAARSSMYQANRHSGGLITAVPTLIGQTVYINEGHRVRAIDRFSQRVMWSTTVGRADAQPSPGDLDPPADMNVIVVEGDALVTLTGHGRQSYRSGRGEVVCLDRQTGDVRWRVHLDAINGRAEFERLFPHGAPIIAEGMVFVLARKPTRELLSSCYLVALDLESGELRWTRYLAASSGLQREDVRPITSPIYDDGELFVATPLGALAAISAATGEVRWLKRYSVPILALPRTRVPWEIASPVIVDRGLVAITPDQRAVVVLDRETGDELERHDSVNLGSPRYLLADHFSVYAVGDSIFAYTKEDLSIPRWTMDRATLGELRGRVQLAQGGLVVPSTEAVLQLDDVTGAPVARIQLVGGGNPLAVGPQLFIAGTDELRSYMAIGVAEDMLRERIVNRPHDPEPSLSLLRLAMRAGDLSLALDATDAVMSVLERMPRDAVGRGAARSELFEQLLALDRSEVSRTDDEGDALHARLTMIAESTSDRVRQILARGDWLARSANDDLQRQQDAAAAFDTVLSDSSLARAPFVNDAVVWPARMAAARRLSQLVTRYGHDSLGAVREEGRTKLAAAMDAGDAVQLASVVSRYPELPESPRAMVAAARLLEESGRVREAIAMLLEYAPSRHDESAAEVYGAIVEIAVRNGWQRLAASWLERAQHDTDLAEVHTAAGSRAVDAWLRELQPATSPVLPALGDFRDEVETKRLPGRLLIPIDEEAKSADEAYLLQGSNLFAIGAPELETRWSVQMPASRVSLIGNVGSYVLVRVDGDARRLTEPSVVALHKANGVAAWTSSDLLTQLFGTREPDRIGALREEVMPNGQVFDPAEVIPLVHWQELFLIGRLAGMMRVDPDAGPEPAWLVDHGFAQVHMAKVHDLALVVAGSVEVPGRNGRPRRQAAVRLFDPGSGDLLHEIRPQDDQSVRWLTIAQDGRLAFGTNSAVEVYSLASGRRQYANQSDLAPDMVNGWPSATGFLMQDSASAIRSVTDELGTIGESIMVPGGDWVPSELVGMARTEEAWVAQYRDRVLYFDDLGRLSGRDAIVEDRNYSHVIPARGRVYVISHIRRPRSVIPEPGRRPSLFVDRVYVLSENGMVIGGRDVESESAPLIAAGAVDGWLLLSGDQSTVAVSVPGNRQGEN